MTLPDPSPGDWQQDESGLSLVLPLEDGKPHRLQVDFVTGAMGYRLRHSGRGQAIAKAIGIKKGRPLPSVWDLTAGLGRDSFVLAWLGCRVAAVERDARIFALLQDGLRRALEEQESAAGLGDRLQVFHADAMTWLQAQAFIASDTATAANPSNPPLPDVLYLDPMHPPRRKSAQVRKEMRMFRELVGTDPDAQSLLTAALSAAEAVGAGRVVVKRPRHGEPLLPVGEGANPALQPNHQFQGKSTRFDIYLTN